MPKLGCGRPPSRRAVRGILVCPRMPCGACARCALHPATATLVTLPAKPARDGDPGAEALHRLLACAMPYGKYKGRALVDLPGHYLNWLARRGFPRGELGRLLALMHELDHNGLKSLLDPLRK